MVLGAAGWPTGKAHCPKSLDELGCDHTRISMVSLSTEYNISYIRTVYDMYIQYMYIQYMYIQYDIMIMYILMYLQYNE